MDVYEKLEIESMVRRAVREEFERYDKWQKKDEKYSDYTEQYQHGDPNC